MSERKPVKSVRGYQIDVQLLMHAKKTRGVPFDEFATLAQKTSIAKGVPYGNRRCRDWYFTLEDQRITGYFYAGTDHPQGGAKIVNGKPVEVVGLVTATAPPSGGTPHIVTREDLFGEEKPAPKGVVKKKSQPYPQQDLPPSSVGICPHCGGTGKVEQYTECEWCDGRGCSKCGGTGEVKILIPCQECNKPNVVGVVFKDLLSRLNRS